MLMTNELIKQIIETTKTNSFREEYRDKVSDEEALGIAISKHFEWNGQAIFETAKSAFEDSNFHSFNTKFEEVWNSAD